MNDELRDAYFPFHAHQYTTFKGKVFFGRQGERGAWTSRPDFPLRYFIWKINRDALLNLWDWRLELHTVVGLAGALEALRSELLMGAEFSFLDIDDDELIQPDDEGPLVQWTLEIDAFNSWSDVEALTPDLVAELESQYQCRIVDGMLDAVMALVHVDSAVEALERADAVTAGAYAVKAQESYALGLESRGDGAREWLTRYRMAHEGADRAHEHNRQVKAQALAAYDAGNWPSKMQAARTIAKQVSRTELVVLRWIREHTRSPRE